MRINFDKIASYMALILITALPLSVNALIDAEKKLNPTVLSSDNDVVVEKRKPQKNKEQ